MNEAMATGPMMSAWTSRTGATTSTTFYAPSAYASSRVGFLGIENDVRSDRSAPLDAFLPWRGFFLRRQV